MNKFLNTIPKISMTMALIIYSFGMCQVIKRGSIEDIRSTLSLPHFRENINSIDKQNHFTFMHYAAKYNRSDVIACLVSFGGGKCT